MGKTIKWLILGIFLRLLIIPFTGHWDQISLNQVAYIFFHDGPGSAYQYYYAIYPPLTYIFLGAWQKIISPFLAPDFYDFLSGPIAQSFLSNHVYRYLFLLKFPYLFFDIGIAFLLRSLVSNSLKKELIFKMWMLNPIVLYVTFAWGTIDIIPAFLSLLAIYFYNRSRLFWAVFSLGFAASFKVFPLLLILPLVLLFTSDWKKRFKALLIGILPLVITIGPFMANKNFVSHFFTSDQLQVIQHAGFYIGRDTNLSLFYIFYFMLLFYLNRRPQLNISFPPWVCFLIFMIFYAFSAFTPQWFLWGLPLLMLILIRQNISLKWWWGINLIYFTIVLLFEVTLNLGLLAPLEVTFMSYPSLGDKLNDLLTLTRVNGIARSVLASVLLWFIYLTKPAQNYETA